MPTDEFGFETSKCYKCKETKIKTLFLRSSLKPDRCPLCIKCKKETPTLAKQLRVSTNKNVIPSKYGFKTDYHNLLYTFRDNVYKGFKN